MMFRHPATPDTIAAVDLGSNSFHMIVAKVVEGHFQVIDKLREMVRLGAGLTPEKQLSHDAEERALDCLRLFGQRLQSLPEDSVRAVGTNTLRQVRDSRRFLHAAEVALGHPIEIISGREEARLIYLGVSHSVETEDEQRLVVDIGGGSTELIIGSSFNPRLMESVHMGCVSMSRSYFPDGRISERAMKKAELSGALQMRPVEYALRTMGWQLALGCSGTIRAIQDAIVSEGWSEARDGITHSALRQLRAKLVESGHVDRIQLEGVSSQRAPVFAGGVAVLSSVFYALNIDKMVVSEMALREGVLYDMLGRIHHEDVRQSSVDALCRRYEVDLLQAQRVEATVRTLFAQVAESWGLAEGEYPNILGWAAQLHELGLTVSHAQFHKHGAYLIANSDMAGFSREEQGVLAALIRAHRRKFPLDIFHNLPEELSQCAMQLCLILRLAVLLHRARSPSPDMDVTLVADKERLIVRFPKDWLKSNPLVKMELKQEKKYLKAAGFKLKYD